MVEYAAIPYDDELTHWGIKGMKWGVRRYQTKDGKLTEKGRKRYNKDMEKIQKEKYKLAQEAIKLNNAKQTQAKIDRLNKEKESIAEIKKKLKDGTVKFIPKEEIETPEQKKARLLKSVDAKELYENRHLLTKAEMDERINRIDTEAKLKSRIVEEKEQTGMELLNEKMKNASNTLNNATDLYKKVDGAYSTVVNSAIGKTLAKKLGIEPPREEFNISKLWEKRNYLSDKEIQNINQRLKNERGIEDEIKRREKQAKKDTGSKTSDTKPGKTESSKDKGSKDSSESKDKTDSSKPKDAKSLNVVTAPKIKISDASDRIYDGQERVDRLMDWIRRNNNK